MSLVHVDLFSGIGGFALAARWAGIETVQFVELDPFCQKVLAKQFPGVPIHDDIRTFTYAESVGWRNGDAENTGKTSREINASRDKNELLEGRSRPFLLTAGAPCQPASCAGKRRGTEDDRWLWGEAIRVLAEVKPTWAIFENVAGLLSLESGVAFDNLLSQVEAQGYETITFIIPACAVNAPHRRDRVWIVGYSGQRNGDEGRDNETRAEAERGESAGEHQRSSQTDRHAPDTGISEIRGGYWSEPWLEAAQRFCGVSHGIPDRLVRYSLTIAETNGIIGFSLMLRRYYYGTSKETGTGKALSILQEAFGEESVQWCFGKLSEVFREEDLWCPVHGKVDGERKENQVGISEGGIEVSKKELRTMRNGSDGQHPSYRHGLEKQCSCEFDDLVCELSSEIALGEWKRNAEKAENILHRMWEESRGERFLHEPLSALYEIWRSVTDYEIGAFRRHYSKRNEHRVQKLKSLGNAIVPQVAYELMGAIVRRVG